MSTESERNERPVIDDEVLDRLMDQVGGHEGLELAGPDWGVNRVDLTNHEPGSGGGNIRPLGLREGRCGGVGFW